MLLTGCLNVRLHILLFYSYPSAPRLALLYSLTCRRVLRSFSVQQPYFHLGGKAFISLAQTSQGPKIAAPLPTLLDLFHTTRHYPSMAYYSRLRLPPPRLEHAVLRLTEGKYSYLHFPHGNAAQPGH